MKKTVMFIIVATMSIVFAACDNSNGLDAPTGLTVTDSSPITLSWSGVSGATSYNVYRGTVSGGLSTKARVSFDDNSSSYTDLSTIVGTTYYYQVTAEDSDGVSDPSIEVHATAQSQDGSSNPFMLIGSKNGSGIVLSWSNVSGAVRYNVYRDTISAVITHKTLIASGILTTTYTDVVVVSGNTYFYQVTAVNASGVETDVTDEASVPF